MDDDVDSGAENNPQHHNRSSSSSNECSEEVNKDSNGLGDDGSSHVDSGSRNKASERNVQSSSTISGSKNTVKASDATSTPAYLDHPAGGYIKTCSIGIQTDFMSDTSSVETQTEIRGKLVKTSKATIQEEYFNYAPHGPDDPVPGTSKDCRSELEGSSFSEDLPKLPSTLSCYPDASDNTDASSGIEKKRKRTKKRSIYYSECEIEPVEDAENKKPKTIGSNFSTFIPVKMQSSMEEDTSTTEDMRITPFEDGEENRPVPQLPNLNIAGRDDISRRSGRDNPIVPQLKDNEEEDEAYPQSPNSDNEETNSVPEQENTENLVEEIATSKSVSEDKNEDSISDGEKKSPRVTPLKIPKSDPNLEKIKQAEKLSPPRILSPIVEKPEVDTDVPETLKEDISNIEQSPEQKKLSPIQEESESDIESTENKENSFTDIHSESATFEAKSCPISEESIVDKAKEDKASTKHLKSSTIENNSCAVHEESETNVKDADIENKNNAENDGNAFASNVQQKRKLGVKDELSEEVSKKCKIEDESDNDAPTSEN
ncbi:hypothetical protein CDAR_410151 [Caerostris darwini]|uniref:Uncharacterized protein n=1 Tax=Caerostris darwini TaxID=1538125 RepID=A0AAV4VY76_9ARAC|nr:hypothetical protein CDAR_410151 [Caerostris darwini]